MVEYRLGDLWTWWNIDWVTYKHGAIKNVWLVGMVECRLGDLETR